MVNDGADAEWSRLHTTKSMDDVLHRQMQARAIFSARARGGTGIGIFHERRSRGFALGTSEKENKKGWESADVVEVRLGVGNWNSWCVANMPWGESMNRCTSIVKRALLISTFDYRGKINMYSSRTRVIVALQWPIASNQALWCKAQSPLALASPSPTSEAVLGQNARIREFYVHYKDTYLHRQ
jgi:hypothetical protein